MARPKTATVANGSSTVSEMWRDPILDPAAWVDESALLHALGDPKHVEHWLRGHPVVTHRTPLRVEGRRVSGRVEMWSPPLQMWFAALLYRSVRKRLRPLVLALYHGHSESWPGAQELIAMARAGQAAANRVKAVVGDRAMLPNAVDLVLAGEPTKVVATRLGIGILRAKRIRALALREGLLPARARGG